MSFSKHEKLLSLRVELTDRNTFYTYEEGTDGVHTNDLWAAMNLVQGVNAKGYTTENVGEAEIWIGFSLIRMDLTRITRLNDYCYVLEGWIKTRMTCTGVCRQKATVTLDVHPSVVDLRTAAALLEQQISELSEKLKKTKKELSSIMGGIG